jgi:hypothetical protein
VQVGVKDRLVEDAMLKKDWGLICRTTKCGDKGFEMEKLRV